ncbi:MAG: PorT family protein [Bacteroidetes bacterium]|nr:PorT family protein [Bacteroidota bacterium]
MLIFVLLSFSSSIAQPLKSYGLKLGGTFATQSWEFSRSPQFTPEYQLGPAAGIFVEGFKVGNFSVLAEFWYLQKGFSTTIDKVAISPKLVYLSLPFFLKYRIGDMDLTYYVMAGPRIDYLFQIDAQHVTAVTDAFSEGNSDIGISVGIGSQFNVWLVGNVITEFRFSPSLVNAFQNDSLTIRNNSFELVLGIAM